MSEEFEEMERIPWAALAAGAPDPRRRLAVAAVAVVAVVVLLVIVGGSLLRSGEPDVGSAASGVTDSEITTTTTNRSESAAIQPSRQAPELESAAVDDEMRIAAMWAERFVRDYLTIDGDGSTALDAARLVGADLPATPNGVTSFVEWVDGYAVTVIQPARYRVEVGYRLLTGSDGSYVRQPAAALAVVVDVAVDRTATIAGLPEVIEMPGLRVGNPPDVTSEIPDWVLEGGATEGASVLGGYRQGSRWWLVLMSELAPGVVRPHVVSVEG